jgi:hypothetical protein
MKTPEKWLWALAATALLAVAATGPEQPAQGNAMQPKQESPRPQPTESEAIVAAQRAPQTPKTRLLPPVPLPVDEAAALPADAEKDAGALLTGKPIPSPGP